LVKFTAVMVKIGNKLRGLRNEKGLSSAQVASQLDISEVTYRRYENDKTFPDIFTLEKIAKIYDKHFTDLLPSEMVVINNNDQSGGNSSNVLIINEYLSEKLIAQYEERIKELKEEVLYWKSKAE
jgi:transcriptional regulator with XRE-family HTH domain